MKNAISVRQICFILIAYNAVSKLIIYPTTAANAVGNDLIFPALFNLIAQTVIIWALAYLSSKTDKTFFELLSTTFNKVTARIIYALFALYFLLSAIMPLNEQQLFMQDAFYETVPAIYMFLPIFFFTVYAGAKSFTNTGRCADICFPIFLVITAALIVMSTGMGKYDNLLPILKQPAKKIAGASLGSVFRFSDSAFLLLFLGHYKYRKGDAAKLTLSYVAGGLIVIALMANFYALYGPLTATRTFMLSNISVFFPAINFVGRIDLLLLYALDIVILFAVVLNIQACVHCLALAFNWQKRWALSLIVNAVLVTVIIVLRNKFSQLLFAAEGWFWIPAVIFAYILPVLAWALKRGRVNEAE